MKTAISTCATAAAVLAAWLFAFPPVAAAADYIIGEGDVLTITVWGEKDLSVSTRVRPDGKITIPAVGEVFAANTTPKELQALLTEKVGRIVKSPIVTVMVAEITNNKVYIFGGGVSSGVFSLNQRTTLLQLLCQIGQQQAPAGTAVAANPPGVRYADLRNAYLLRNGKKIKANFHSLYIDGDITEDIAIQPNDAVFIPSLAESSVYVIGAVNTPRAIEYRDGLTVMGAILEAGGFTKFADQNDTVIYRKNGDKDLTIAVKVKKLINRGDLSQNLPLKPGDYIVVNEGIF